MPSQSKQVLTAYSAAVGAVVHTGVSANPASATDDGYILVQKELCIVPETCLVGPERPKPHKEIVHASRMGDAHIIQEARARGVGISSYSAARRKQVGGGRTAQVDIRPEIFVIIARMSAAMSGVAEDITEGKGGSAARYNDDDLVGVGTQFHYKGGHIANFYDTAILAQVGAQFTR